MQILDSEIKYLKEFVPNNQNKGEMSENKNVGLEMEELSEINQDKIQMMETNQNKGEMTGTNQDKADITIGLQDKGGIRGSVKINDGLEMVKQYEQQLNNKYLYNIDNEFITQRINLVKYNTLDKQFCIEYNYHEPNQAQQELFSKENIASQYEIIQQLLQVIEMNKQLYNDFKQETNQIKIQIGNDIQLIEKSIENQIINKNDNGINKRNDDYILELIQKIMVYFILSGYLIFNIVYMKNNYKEKNADSTYFCIFTASFALLIIASLLFKQVNAVIKEFTLKNKIKNKDDNATIIFILLALLIVQSFYFIREVISSNNDLYLINQMLIAILFALFFANQFLQAIPHNLKLQKLQKQHQ